MKTRLNGHEGRIDPHAALDLAQRIRQALFDAIVGADAGDEAALTVERATAPIAPALLARSHPGGAAARAQMQTLYERCLAHYRSVVRAGEPDGHVDDVGAAAARFVAANMRALHGVDPSPPMLWALERQLAGIVKLSAAWATASGRQRQLYFEKIAIVAVLVHETFTQAVLQGPAAIANVRAAARGYLRDLLGFDPDELSLEEDGLAWAKRDAD